MSAPALELTRLTVHSGSRRLLDLDHVLAAPSAITALMGPNGAGKTTLLKTCLGLVRPSSGRAAVLDENVGALRGAKLAALRRRVGYVAQLLPSQSELPLTVREVVAIGRTARAGLLHPLSRDDWQAVDAWINRLGLVALADQAFRQLSGGEQRKAMIARAMVQEPQLLLLDEPTANLDLGWRERIVETIEALYAQMRLSIVLVCHELEVLPPSCSQVVLLEGGRVSAMGSPYEVFTTERVSELYGAGLQPVHRAGRHAVVPGGARHD